MPLRAKAGHHLVQEGRDDALGRARGRGHRHRRAHNGAGRPHGLPPPKPTAGGLAVREPWTVGRGREERAAAGGKERDAGRAEARDGDVANGDDAARRVGPKDLRHDRAEGGEAARARPEGRGGDRHRRAAQRQHALHLGDAAAAGAARLDGRAAVHRRRRRHRVLLQPRQGPGGASGGARRHLRRGAGGEAAQRLPRVRPATAPAARVGPAREALRHARRAAHAPQPGEAVRRVHARLPAAARPRR
mmetsp:Transcript_9255/g.23023  ORF Transcript_9255/g.23023 Transcript_9255/m.23023 type:complete len:247 (-) Transcript_9255:290-1030(-)